MPQNALTIDELAARAGVTVRTVRFYGARGLLPPPQIGPRRVGHYGPGHLSRLALIEELRRQGLTLAAIERYMAQLPPDVGEHDLAIHRALVASWLPEGSAKVGRQELERRAGRTLGEPDVERLAAMTVLERTADPDVFVVDPGLLHLGVRLLDLPVPLEAIVAAREALQKHARAAAGAIGRIFRETVREPGADPDAGAVPDAAARTLSAQMQPLVVQALVTAFQRSLKEQLWAWPAPAAEKP
ncbi:MerR family transcriptional regulator [Actinacidiphila epipremni]|uniref:MerR family transcriptional regulator n=1 Tax=Actinacidiphila epipremni TaxID=2053013 RepID=A0ABX0ZPS3_9ACTN|nr:MerR family transcriptional regulator [Actinacidiphila epipremni]NJP43799.1 MerR family transcriptional regulator [Actinacidiphila epipremni]